MLQRAPAKRGSCRDESQANSTITASTARLSPGLALTFFTVPSIFGAQHVFHLHGFNHRHGFAGLHFLAFLDGDGDDQARHRTQHEFGGVGRLFHRHQPRISGFDLGVDVNLRLDALISERKAVRNSPYLHRDRM